MRLVLLTHHPVVLPNGRTPLKIVAEGWGMLRVIGPRSTQRALVLGRLERTIFVDAAPTIEVRANGGSTVVKLHVLPTAPMDVRVRVPVRMPDLIAPRVHVRRLDLMPVDLKPRVVLP